MLAGEDPIQNQSALEEVSVDLTVLLPLVWNVAILADGAYWAHRFARAAVDANVGIDKVLPVSVRRVDAVNGASLDA